MVLGKVSPTKTRPSKDDSNGKSFHGGRKGRWSLASYSVLLLGWFYLTIGRWGGVVRSGRGTFNWNLRTIKKKTGRNGGKNTHHH